MDMWFKATKSWRRKFEPRMRVWKLKEEKTCEENRCIVGDKVEEAKWKGLGVNDHWQQMKALMMETAQDIHRVSKKQDTKLLPITSPNFNRFSKFFHWQTHW